MTKITLGAIGVLTLLLLASGWLIKGLYEDVGQLEQANAQLAQSAREQAEENAQLNAELNRRDSVVTSSIKARQLAEKVAQTAQTKLYEALADDACANSDHPDAIADSLRSLSADYSDQDNLPLSANGSD